MDWCVESSQTTAESDNGMISAVYIGNLVPHHPWYGHNGLSKVMEQCSGPRRKWTMMMMMLNYDYDDDGK